MTAAAVTSGAMALSKSYMFTREAFCDYLDHLTPTGVILMTRPFGSIGASILGMAFGFTAVLAISGACYLIALSAMIIAIAHSTHEPTPTYSGSPNALLFG